MAQHKPTRPFTDGNLRKVAAETLAARPGKKTRIVCRKVFAGAQPGLSFFVQPGGAVSWAWRRMVAGATALDNFGSFPAVDCAQANAKAADANAAIEGVKVPSPGHVAATVARLDAINAIPSVAGKLDDALAGLRKLTLATAGAGQPSAGRALYDAERTALRAIVEWAVAHDCLPSAVIPSAAAAVETPKDEKPTDGTTFLQLWRRYKTYKLNLPKGKRGWKDGSTTPRAYTGAMKNHAKVLQDRPAAEVTRDEIATVLRGVGKTAMRERMAKWLDGTFAHAVRLGIRPDNPADKEAVNVFMDGAAFAHEGKQRPALHFDDVAAVLAAIDHPAGDLVRFTARNAQRRDEARLLDWSEVDLERRRVCIPPARDKNKHGFCDPLSAQDMDLLRRIGPKESGFVFVDPKAKGQRPRPFGEDVPNEVLQKAAVRIGVKATCGNAPTLHGLRRSFGSWADDNGMPFELKEAALSHAVGNAVERKYTEHEWIDERRPHLQRWADFISPARCAPDRVTE